MRVRPERAAMPGATPAGGTAVEPAGSLRLAPREAERLAVVEVTALRHDADALLDEGQRVGVLGESHAEDLGEALGGQVVVGGPEAAPDHEQVGFAAQGVPQRRGEALAVVGDGQQLGDLDAPPAEVVADERAVGVPRAPVQQLVAAEDHGGARRARRHQLLVPGMWMRPRAFLK